MEKDLLFFIVFIAVVLIGAIPLGRYMKNVFTLQPLWGDAVIRPIEKGIYTLVGTKESETMNWKEYVLCVIGFNVVGAIVLFVLQLVQAALPLNPHGVGNVSSWHLAWNTAVSFMTNTNWQSYGGETTMSYFTQMAGLTVQNFVSAGTGIAVAVALMRGLTGHTSGSVGNFWVDLVRSVTRILLPLSLVLACVLVAAGVPQNLQDYVQATTLEGAKQVLAQGPVASQEAIKVLGTNGGGFFNANSAHPYENPTPLTNVLEMFSILWISAGLVIMFGHMAGNKKQGYAILGVMTLLFVLLLALCYGAEKMGNPIIGTLGVSGDTAMEGKEVRFGIGGSTLFTAVTTAASCGAVNAMHDSYTGLGGFVPMLQMMLGEVIFGGTGAGFYGMMLYVVIAVFIVGLMVGRTPEYLGKKVESKEIVWTIIGLLLPAVTTLTFTALSCLTPQGLAGISEAGPHGFSEILYAFSSGAGNNGSAFAGLQANSLWYNVLMGIAMLIGRFGVIIPVLIIAGAMGNKKVIPAGSGTFDTGTLLFTFLLGGIVLIVGALTFFPALALGPVVDHLFLLEGTVF